MPINLDELGFVGNLEDLIPLDEWISTQELIEITGYSKSSMSIRLMRLRAEEKVKRVKHKTEYLYQRTAVEA